MLLDIPFRLYWHVDVKRRVPNVFNKLALLEKDQRKSPTQIKQDQFRALKKLLIHAFENCDYYRDKFNSCGINPYQVMSWNDFYKVPILKKKDIQKNPDAILAKDVNKKELFEDATGGSTGEPLIFYHDRECKEWFEACDIFAKKWWGITPWCKKAFLWGADRDIPELSLKERLKLKLERSTFLNSFDMDDTKMEAYARFLIKWRPEYLQGYASSLHLFSTYLLKNNITVPKPKAIRSSADTLTPEKRVAIERIFGDRIYDFYGSREITNIAAECPAHQGLHIFSTIRYVEILNDHGEQLVNRPGKIIVTDLVNYSMPFIRYEIGDVGIISDKECECGRPFPILKSIEGRITDFIQTCSGKQIHGEFFTHLFYGVKNILDFQVHQENLDALKIYIVAETEVDKETLSKITEKIQKKMGEHIDVVIKFVDKIPPTKTGKRLFTISSVPPMF